MIFVTMVLTSSEIERIDQQAMQQWPQEAQSGRLSRTETCRRFALAGVAHMREASAEERKQLTRQFQESVNTQIHNPEFRGQLPVKS